MDCCRVCRSQFGERQRLGFPNMGCCRKFWDQGSSSVLILYMMVTPRTAQLASQLLDWVGLQIVGAFSSHLQASTRSNRGCKPALDRRFARNCLFSRLPVQVIRRHDGSLASVHFKSTCMQAMAAFMGDRAAAVPLIILDVLRMFGYCAAWRDSVLSQFIGSGGRLQTIYASLSLILHLVI